MSTLKKLILVRGLPGSGKTTFTDFLLDFLLPDMEVHSYAADDYFTSEDGSYHFDASKLGVAHAQCLNNTLNAMRDSANLDECVILVHNTFTTSKELKPYLDAAKAFDFEVTSLIVENRHGNKSIHNVPDDVMTKMKTRFSVNV